MNTSESTYSSWFYGGALLLLLIAVVAGLYFLLSSYFARSELGTKGYYAALQGIELDNVHNKSQGLILKENVNGSGLNILGLPSGTVSDPRVWVILNRVSSEGQPLVMPSEVPIKVDCVYVRDAMLGQQVVNVVREYLLKNCTHK